MEASPLADRYPNNHKPSFAVLLALDTSTRYSGIALYTEGRVLLEHTWQSAHYHTRHLAPAVERALTVTGLEPGDLQAVAVALGPGSFTGLRIGLAFGKGLALAQHIPILGIPTLDFLAAAQAPSALPLLAFLQAGRGRYSAQWFRWEETAWEAASDLRVWQAEEMASQVQEAALVCGEFTADLRRLLTENAPQARLLSPAACVRRPAYLAELAWARWQQGESDDPVSLAPLYLHYR